MIEVGQVFYPRSLRQELYINLQERLNKRLEQTGLLHLLKGKLSYDENHNILTIYAHTEIRDLILKSNILTKEQKIINIFNYNNRIKEEKLLNPFEDEYIDSEYKCKFIFGDGLKIINYLLPNEYDSLQIEHFPYDELHLLEKFQLNYEAILTIEKQNDSLFVKCSSSSLAEQFYNHIQEKEFVYDNENRVIVKPLITENLHTNKSQFVITTKFKSNQNELDIQQYLIQSIIDKFAKNQYKLQMSSQNNLLTSEVEKVCYLIFDKQETADSVKDFTQGQTSTEITFTNMEIQQLRQGKITLDMKVFLYYEHLLKQIKQADYKIFTMNEILYEEEEKTAGLNNIQIKKVIKEIIPLFEQPKESKQVNIIIQAKSDKLVFKGLYEVQMLIKPKLLHQLVDTYQYNIFAEQKGRDKLKELSFSQNIFINYNYQLNRLEFYSYTTQKQSKPKIDILLKQIEEFIQNYEITALYPICKKDPFSIISYLNSKNYEVNLHQNKIQTKIKYSKIKEENSYIIEKFVIPMQKDIEDCQICYDTQELFQLTNCKCKSICKSCLKQHIETDVRSSIIDYKITIMCPSCKKEPISIKDISRIFDKFNLIDIFKMRFKSAIEKLLNEDGKQQFKGCEFPDCKGIFKVPSVIVPGMKNSWQCSMCQHEYCIKHILKKNYDIPLHEIHDNDYSCEAQVKDFGVGDLVQLGLIKQCPQCKTKFSHETGCNHLECKQCKCHFCAVCEFNAKTSREVYDHLHLAHNGYDAIKAKNLTVIDDSTKQQIEKKVLKKTTLNADIRKAGDSDDEEEMYKKLQLNFYKSHIFSQYDSNIYKALQVDEEFIPQVSNQLFDR